MKSGAYGRGGQQRQCHPVNVQFSEEFCVSRKPAKDSGAESVLGWSKSSENRRFCVQLWNTRLLFIVEISLDVAMKSLA